MKIRPIFLLPWLVYIFFIVGFSPAWSQENLPTLIKKVQQSVVLIITYNEDGEILGQGSGFFISTEGDVITNIHVLEGAHRADVKTAEGKIYPVRNILAEDREADLIRVSVDISHKDVHPLPVSASIPEVGEQVVVIGNPLGLEQTASDGIVSAVREIPSFGKIIQITAPVSPGSSGSPVVNMKGEVIGVATFIMLEGQNLNFAIPGERVAKLTPTKGKALAEWQSGRTEEELDSVEGLYSTGLTFLWAEDYEKALPYFEDAVKKNPDYAEAYFTIGYCNLSLGYPQKAIEAFRQAISIKPDFVEVHFYLGVAYINLGQPQEAIEAFKRAISIKPDVVNQSHFYLGVAYDKLGRYPEAIEAYKEAIRIKPDDAQAHYYLGVVYGNLGRYQEAIEAFKQAIRIKPDYSEAHKDLGAAYDNLGRYQEAIEAYKEAIRIRPNFAEAHHGLGLAYGNLGRYQETIEAFKQAIRIKPDYAEAHSDLGVTYGKLGRYQEAIEAYKEAIRIKPNFAKAHFILGGVYLLIGDRGSALDEYRILKDLDRDLANKLFNLIYK